MKINIYLPDVLGERAKKEELNLSRMLRDAVASELGRRDAMASALNETTAYELELETHDEWTGEPLPYIGRVTGREIANVADEVRVFITEDGRVLAYSAAMGEYQRLDEPPGDLAQRLSTWLPEPADYIKACQILGIRPVLDI